MTTQKKTVNINIRTTPTIKTMAEKAAAGDRRSVASLIEKLIVDHVRKTAKE